MKHYTIIITPDEFKRELGEKLAADPDAVGAYAIQRMVKKANEFGLQSKKCKWVTTRWEKSEDSWDCEILLQYEDHF